VQKQSKTYIYIFSVIVCIFVSVIIALSSILLKPRQQIESRLDVVRNILSVSGQSEESISSMKPDEILNTYKSRFSSLFLDKSNQTVDRVEIEKKLSVLGYKPEELSEMFPFELIAVFNSKLSLLAKKAEMKPKDYDPGYKLIFISFNKDDIKKEKPELYIIPISGFGLWGMMYGYLSLAPDLNTVTGIRFYSHQETPGLGGEAEKPWFTSQFISKKILSDTGELVSISVVKGKAAELFSGDELSHHVDGISGATITGNSITDFMKNNLLTFEPYFKTIRPKTEQKEVSP